MLTIDFLRHGELQGGIKYRGMLDEPLTSKGRQDMDMVWSQLQHDVSMIITSPLSRCLQPAQEWAAEQGVSCHVEPAIQELDYGAWEGLTAAQIQQQYPNALEVWRKDPSGLTPPQGESMDNFSQRTKRFLDDLIQVHSSGHILIVAHSGSIRLLLTHALGAPIKTTRHWAVPYACWSRIAVNDGHCSLLFHHKN